MATKEFAPIMYADDTTLIGNLDTFTDLNNAASTSNKLNAELTKITDWLAVNKLALNNSKTKLMIFQNIQKKLKNNEIPTVKINNVLIERLSVLNFLGIQIDENLSWTPHQNSIANKLSRICRIITRLKQYVPLYILKIIYNSLFVSIVSQQGGGVNLSHGHRLIKLQKKAIRYIAQSKYNSHTSPLFKNLSVLTIVYTQNGLFKIILCESIKQTYTNRRPRRNEVNKLDVL